MPNSKKANILSLNLSYLVYFASHRTYLITRANPSLLNVLISDFWKNAEGANSLTSKTDIHSKVQEVYFVFFRVPDSETSCVI